MELIRGVVFLLILTPSVVSSAAPPFVAGFDRLSASESVSKSVLGDVLLTELSCTACHHSDFPTLKAKGGPNLDAIGLRVSLNWLKSYLNTPHEVKPGTTMPDVLSHLSTQEKEDAIAALSAFLSTQRKPFPEVRASGANPVPHQFWNKGSVDRGRELYHSVGCVACHAPGDDHEIDVRETALDRLIRDLDPEELKDLGLSNAAQPVNSVPHSDLKTKYSRESLTQFLLNPELSRPSGRMPSLKLKPMEAADIAAYLLGSTTGGTTLPKNNEQKLVDRGRELFASLRCANCHQVGEKVETSLAKSLDALDVDAESNCFGDSQSGLPQYHLSDSQKNSLLAACNSSSRREEASSSPISTSLRLNCYACHERDGLGGVGRKRQSYFETVGNVDIGDEGRLPPSLSHVGMKLKPDWMKKVFAGTGDIRPHLTIRMPKFPATHIRDLPPQFATADQNEVSDKRDALKHEPKLVDSGRQLLNTGCVQCHPIRGESLPGVVGTDLVGVTDRVHQAWFQQFLRNPIELKSRTRMPTFFPNGVSSNPAILDGNVDQQIAAIWSYLKVANKSELPEKVLQARSRSFELTPNDRPILLRTFMEKSGMHAIAVGFPEQLHIAFDAERVDLAEAWKGKFLDAHGTWFDRFTPLAQPLGTDRIDLRSTFRLVTVPVNVKKITQEMIVEEHRFLGYELDRDSVPTFRYRIGNCEIADRIAPSKDGTLVRDFRVRRGEKETDSAIAIAVQGGTPIETRFAFKDSKLQLFVSEDILMRSGEMKVVRSDIRQLLYRLPQEKEIEFEVEYKW